MDPHILVSRARDFSSPSDAAHYVRTHLADHTEAGAMRHLDGYLDAAQRVVPILLNQDLWLEVGLPPEARQIPEKLLMHLCQGMDHRGRQIARINLHAPPKEYILTAHCEVSEAMESYPLIGRETLRAMALEALAFMEARATRVRLATGLREWCRARMLAALYCHARNKEDEPNFHGHLFALPIVRLPELGWRRYHESANFRDLNSADGLRSRVGAALRTELAAHDFHVDFKEGQASATALNGATVRCPDGRVIQAGSVIRTRTTKIQADLHLKDFLGETPLTSEEIRRVQMHRGQPVQSLSAIPSRSRFVRKLRGLGLIDECGQIHSGPELVAAIRAIDQAMSMAQASVVELSHHSPAQIKAIERALAGRRRELREEFGDCLPRETKAATARWSKTFIRFVEEVAACGDDGLSIKSIAPPDQGLLLMLIRAQLLRLEVSEVTESRRAILVTELGWRKLGELQKSIRAASQLRYASINQISCSVSEMRNENRPSRAPITKVREPEPSMPELKFDIPPTRHRRR